MRNRQEIRSQDEVARDSGGGVSLPQHSPFLPLSSSLISSTPPTRHCSQHHLPLCPPSLSSCVSPTTTLLSSDLKKEKWSPLSSGPSLSSCLCQAQEGTVAACHSYPSLTLLSNILSMASCRSCLLNIYRETSGRDESSLRPPWRADCVPAALISRDCW